MNAPVVGGPVFDAIWLKGAGITLALSQASHALSVILALLEHRGVGAPIVWAPAYYCESGLGPLRNSAAQLRFFPVTEAMAPDWPALAAMLSDGPPPDLFILPHLFGTEGEAVAARAFCDSCGALLLEDAAHLLRPVGVVGSHGDFVSFSPRKWLGLEDAGVLVIRDPDLLERLGPALAGLSPTRHVAKRQPRRDWRRWLPFPLPRPLPERAMEQEPGPATLFAAPWMSEESFRRISEGGPLWLDRVAMQEAATVTRIETALRSLRGLWPLPRHPDATPYLLGFRAESDIRAADLHRELRLAGAVAANWPGLPPEVWAEPQRYGAAVRLRRTVIRLTPRFASGRQPLDFVSRIG